MPRFTPDEAALIKQAHAQLQPPERRAILEAHGRGPRKLRDIFDVARRAVVPTTVLPLGLDVQREAVVLAARRPVLGVRGGTWHARDDNDITEEWATRLKRARIRVDEAIAAVGRVELGGHPELRWAGTAWRVAPRIAVTNRHVAELFATRERGALVFRPPGVTARVDFAEELGSVAPREVRVEEVLYLEDAADPDIAFLRLAEEGPFLALADHVAPGAHVVTVGYPTRDDRVPNQQLAEKLLGDVYGKKRVAPGKVLSCDAACLYHDCSTLGGNSGSVVFDLDRGRAVGLHFAGVYLVKNLAVCAPVIAERLDRIDGRSGSSGILAASRPSPSPVRVTSVQGTAPIAASAAPQHGAITLELPLRVTVSIGAVTGHAAVAAHLGPAMPMVGDVADLDLDQAVDRVRALTAGIDGARGVRRGYLFQDGWITDERAVVVLTAGTASVEEVRSRLPNRVGRFAIDVTAQTPGEVAEGLLRENPWQNPTITYQPPQGARLDPIEDDFEIFCHVSPDAGWPLLGDFLRATARRLTVGMYEFTAPHIFDTVRRSIRRRGRDLRLVYQQGAQSTLMGVKNDDLPDDEVVRRLEDSLRNRFEVAWPTLGPRGGIFGTSYHIKIAIRDGEAVWLSSGSWQSTNQPAIAPADEGTTEWGALRTYNREWNVIAHNARLAETFEAYLRHDFELCRLAVPREAPAPAVVAIPPIEPLWERAPQQPARYFPAVVVRDRMKVEPLLSPDNYAERVIALLESAEETIRFQNQSLDLKDHNQREFEDLVGILLAKQRDGVDVRIVIRGDFGPRPKLERLKERGFDMRRVRVQNRCHNKGIVVDQRAVLIGSHNWTNFGVCFNRDASVIVHHPEAASYFADVFDFDWENLASGRIVESLPEFALHREAASVPRGALAVPWFEIDHRCP